MQPQCLAALLLGGLVTLTWSLAAKGLLPLWVWCSHLGSLVERFAIASHMQPLGCCLVCIVQPFWLSQRHEIHGTIPATNFTV